MSCPAFQFHNGLIKRKETAKLPNPLNRFQFHNGLIKSTILVSKNCVESKFQFHNGLIKSENNLLKPDTPNNISIP